MVTSIPPEATRSVGAHERDVFQRARADPVRVGRHDRLCDLGELAVGPEAVEERERLRRHAEARRGRLVGELLRPGEEGIVAAVTGVSVRIPREVDRPVRFVVEVRNDRRRQIERESERLRVAGDRVHVARARGTWSSR